MSVSQFARNAAFQQEDPVENTGNFTCDPRQHERYRMRFHHFSRSGILPVLCVGLRTRKVDGVRTQRSPWLEVCLRWLAAVLQPPGAAFSFSISSIPLSAYHFIRRRQSHKAPLPLHHLAERAFPASASSRYGYGYSHRKCQPALLLLTSLFHSTDKTETTEAPKKPVFSTCRFQLFQEVF